MNRLIQSTRSPLRISHHGNTEYLIQNALFKPSMATRTSAVRTSGQLHKHQNSALASYYRGGTSRAIMFHADSLPTDKSAWPTIFRSVLGSPDPNGRQLDGMGGGLSSLSKVCVVAPSEREDADVDYTIAAVGIKDGDVDLSSNCGNMSAAVGPFAVDTGMINARDIVVSSSQGLGSTNAASNAAPDESQALVRIHNTNTGKIIHAAFPVLTAQAAEAQSDGDLAIDGVAGTAARVRLDFRRPAGSKTGKLLPTGHAVDRIRGVDATCVDVANPAVFVRARDFGVDGAITPDEATAHATLLARLDGVRRAAAVAMGMVATEDAVPGSVPKVCLVAPAARHTLPSGVVQEAADVDVLVRAISVGQPHRAIPITTSLAVASAAGIEGSIVRESLSRERTDGAGVTIGHASGKILVSSVFDDEGELEAATVYRTARRLMEGTVYWR